MPSFLSILCGLQHNAITLSHIVWLNYPLDFLKVTVLPVGSLDDYSEDIPIEDEDELEDVAEVDNTETDNENQ